MIRTRSQILQENEKAKAWSTIIANVGTALFAAGVGTLWLSGPQPWPVVWIILGIAIMGLATHLLNHLESES
jgi:fatty acid desaturase